MNVNAWKAKLRELVALRAFWRNMRSQAQFKNRYVILKNRSQSQIAFFLRETWYKFYGNANIALAKSDCVKFCVFLTLRRNSL